MCLTPGLPRLLNSIEEEKDPEIYLKYKKADFSEKDKALIIKNFLKNLTEKKQPSVFLNEYFKLSILKKVFPKLYKLATIIHDPIFHPEKDLAGLNTVWGHTFIALDISKKLAELFKLDKNESLTLLLGTLLHDIGKPEVTEWEFKRGRMVVTSILHDSRGVKLGEKFLGLINISDTDGFPIKTVILNLIKYHHRIFELHRNKEDIKLNAISKLKKDMLGYEKLLIFLDFADRQSRNPEPLDFNKLDPVSEWILSRRDECLLSEAKPKPMILGRHLIDLGMKPGKEIGLITKEFYNKQLKKEFSNKKDAFKKLKEYLSNK